MLGGWGCTITIILHILDCYICGLYTVYTKSFPWWRHQMETFSALLAIWTGNSQVTGEFPSQRPVMRSFDVFFDLSLNNRLNKQSWGRWFETPLCSLWRHCYVCVWWSDAENTRLQYFIDGNKSLPELVLFIGRREFQRTVASSPPWTAQLIYPDTSCFYDEVI